MTRMTRRHIIRTLSCLLVSVIPGLTQQPAYRANDYADFMAIGGAPIKAAVHEGGSMDGARKTYDGPVFYDLSVRNYRMPLKHALTLLDQPPQVETAYRKPDGKPLALLYRPVVTSTREPVKYQRCPLGSPARPQPLGEIPVHQTMKPIRFIGAFKSPTLDEIQPKMDRMNADLRRDLKVLHLNTWKIYLSENQSIFLVADLRPSLLSAIKIFHLISQPPTRKRRISTACLSFPITLSI